MNSMIILVGGLGLLGIALLIQRRRYRAVKETIPDLIQRGGMIIDVRSRAEYQCGHSRGSINIPLDELDKASHKLDASRPIIVCCASGGRSAMALSLLKKKGHDHVINAGPWQNTCVSK